ncbi:MAG: helix-turn-helix transcriptional regulator [Candidatus Cloacimonetes bacterium]|nr:helix-turn-helix transcriptional regulator [Candidatus Cloacimonadota bacterium]
MVEELAKFIKKKRNELNFTLRDIEEKTGISNAYFSQLENAKIKNPSIKVLRKISDFFKIPFENIMNLLDQDTNAEKVYFRKSNPFLDVSDDEEKKLLEYLQFIRSRK